LVIWLTAMLAMVINSTVHIIYNDVEFSIAQRQAFRCRQLAEMGINVAMNPAVKEFDTALLNQPFPDGGSFSVKIRGEGGRYNINALLRDKDRVFFQRLFTLWGLDMDSGNTLYDRLIDWVDTDDEKSLDGLEKDDYEEIGRLGHPFNRPFYDLDEIPLVPGFDAAIKDVPRWRDYFTIYSAGKLDLNEAEPPVIALGMVASNATSDPLRDFDDFTEQAAEWRIENLFGPDKLEDTDDDVKLQDLNSALVQLGIDTDDPAAVARFGANDQTTHIEAIGSIAEFGVRVVMIVRNRTGQPQILSREEVPF
jgi:general secretion pathway protein K